MATRKGLQTRSLKRMDGKERRKACKVAAIVRQKVLQSMRKHRGCDVGIVDLPAFNRKALDQFAELFGCKSGVFQNLKMANARYHHRCLPGGKWNPRATPPDEVL